MDFATFAAHLPTCHALPIEAYEGSGAYGDVYATAVTVSPCVVDDTRRRVPVQTQDAAGAEAISSTTIYAPPDTIAPPGSRVTLPTGRVARVLSVATRDAHGLPLPAHVELALE